MSVAAKFVILRLKYSAYKMDMLRAARLKNAKPC